MVDIMFVMKSRFTAEVKGEGPERFLNSAAAKGIYISDVQRIDGGIRVRLSRRAYDIMSADMPQGLTIEILREHGAPRLLRKYRRRFLLFGGIPLAAAMIFLSTQFLWRVEIDGGTPELQKQVAAFLEEKGVRPGAYIGRIDQKKLKHEAIIAIDELMWLWVDIHGTTAEVNIASRDMPPEMVSREPANIIASESGVVEKITAANGAPLVSQGETVEKGSILITGVVESERTETMLRHAQGEVLARVWREKTVLIPKVTEIRNRTGNIKKIKSIKIKKFIVNFSLNSSILYSKYDKIRMKYNMGKIPVEFIADEYHEVDVEYVDTDLAQSKADIRSAFENEITASGAEIVSIDESEQDLGDYLEYSITAQCLTDIAKTVPLE